jgi:hypothetical protein
MWHPSVSRINNGFDKQMLLHNVTLQYLPEQKDTGEKNIMGSESANNFKAFVDASVSNFL